MIGRCLAVCNRHECQGMASFGECRTGLALFCSRVAAGRRADWLPVGFVWYGLAMASFGGCRIGLALFCNCAPPARTADWLAVGFVWYGWRWLRSRTNSRIRQKHILIKC